MGNKKKVEKKDVMPERELNMLLLGTGESGKST
jgi:hypothetical protein